MIQSLDDLLKSAETRLRSSGDGVAHSDPAPFAVPDRISRALDHTLLRPDALWEEVRAFAARGIELEVASVCVQPGFVARLRPLFSGRNAGIFAGDSTALCTVIAFPHGASSPRAKTAEARIAIEEGADEIDLVLSIGALRDGAHAFVHDEIARVREAARDRILKVILETAYLTEAEVIRGSLLAKFAGADFVKTSTGYASAGATLEHVRLLRAAVDLTFEGATGSAKKRVGVKASGGIRDLATARAFIEAGADRIGTSSSEKILEEEKQGNGTPL